MDIVKNALIARQAGYDEAEQLRQVPIRRQAGKALAQGDYAGASGALYSGGMLDEGAGVEKLGYAREDRTLRNEDRQLDNQVTQTRLRLAQAEERAGFLRQGAMVLQRIPLEKRGEAFTSSIAPALQQMGMDPAMVQQIAQGPLDDDALRTFIGQLDKQLQIVNRGGGGYDVVDTTTGAAVRSVAPDPKLQIIGDGAIAYDPRTRGVVAENPKNFAPKSGGRGSAPKLPTGFILD